MTRIPEPIVYALWGAAAIAFAWGGHGLAAVGCIAGATLYAYLNRKA